MSDVGYTITQEFFESNHQQIRLLSYAKIVLHMKHEHGQLYVFPGVITDLETSEVTATISTALPSGRYLCQWHIDGYVRLSSPVFHYRIKKGIGEVES